MPYYKNVREYLSVLEAAGKLIRFDKVVAALRLGGDAGKTLMLMDEVVMPGIQTPLIGH